MEKLPMERKKRSEEWPLPCSMVDHHKLKEMGGLGIADLKTLGKVLRVRWLWLKKIEKPWASLPLQFSPCVETLFYMTVTTNVGDRFNSLFWKDRWILG
jgi:hypothetical protein